MKTLLGKLRLTIGTKLISLIAILLIASVASLVWISTRLFIDDNTSLIQQMNSDSAGALMAQSRLFIQNSAEKGRIIGTLLVDKNSQKSRQRVTREIFSKDEKLLAVFVFRGNKVVHRAISTRLANRGDAQGKGALKRVGDDKNLSAQAVSRGESQVSLVSLQDETMAITLAIPFVESPVQPGVFTHHLVLVLDPQSLVKAFSSSQLFTSYLVGKSGELLIHPQLDRVRNRERVAHLEIVKRMLEGKFNNGQTRYVASEKEIAYLGAFRMLGFAGLGVVTEVPEAKAFEAAKRVQYRSGLVAFIILCLSFFAGYLYSGTITWPIKQLVAASRRISKGDFSIQLKPRGRDELAQLSHSFNEMAQGLEERDRVKETFSKFHNKEIAEQLMSGKVSLGGEHKNATVFFSDIRGFTSLSEKMTPHAVVEMLNEYMTVMVEVINQHAGVVDKYVGDAIMAIWGVPMEKDGDTFNAVMACLKMREALEKLNQARISRKLPALKIGMGLNTGEVIAGNIGSEEKMEYTVIGDSVNLASRVEAMTKEFGTDLLISDNVHKLVKDQFIFEKCSEVKVKGKSEPVQIFKVLGYRDQNGTEVIIETPYSSYAAEKSDKRAA